MTITTIP